MVLLLRGELDVLGCGNALGGSVVLGRGVPAPAVLGSVLGSPVLGSPFPLSWPPLLRTLLRRVLGALVTSVDSSAPAAVDSAPVLSAPVPLSSGSSVRDSELEILSTVVPAVAPTSSTWW